VAGGGPLIQGNTISYTTTEYDPRQDFGCDYLDGSGIALEGVASDATVISGNIIEHNIGRCGGGGIRVDYAGAPLIANNTIRYNEAKGQGGGIYMVEGNQLSIIQNLIYGNTAGAGVELSAAKDRCRTTVARPSSTFCGRHPSALE